MMDYLGNSALPGNKIFSKKFNPLTETSYEPGSTKFPNKIWHKSFVKGLISYDRTYKQTEKETEKHRLLFYISLEYRNIYSNIK